MEKVDSTGVLSVHVNYVLIYSKLTDIFRWYTKGKVPGGPINVQVILYNV